MEDAIRKDSQWKAFIPVISTHFQMSDDMTIVIPNTSEIASEINLFDMFNPLILNDESIRRHMDHHLYPRRKGAPLTLLQLERFIGDSDVVIQSLEQTIKDAARQHSTVLTCQKEKRSKRK